MAIDLPKEAIRQLIASLSGVPESRVRWRGEAEKATLSIDGKAGKITLNVVAMTEGNGLEARRVYDVDTDTLTEQWGTTEELTVSVRADNFIGYGAAYDLLRKVRFAFPLPATAETLHAAGLAYIEAPSIVNLDYSVDNRAVSAASLDLRFANLVTNEPTAVTFIAKVTSKAGPFTEEEIAALPVADLAFTKP